jgi:hypothetical protein
MVKMEQNRGDKGENKMDVKMKRSKAITGIAMAVIMLASVLVAMVPTVSTVSIGDNFNYIGANLTGQIVLVGQNVQFNNTGPYMWTDPANVRVQKFEDGIWYDYAGPWSGGTAYNINWNPALTLRATDLSGSDTTLSVQDPNIPLKLKVGTKEVSSLTVGTNLTIDTGGINLFDNDRVDFEIIGPDGKITTKNGQNFSHITVTNLEEYGTTGTLLNTTGWKIGAYTFQIKTKSEYACGLDANSDVKDLTIVKGEIDISAEKTTVTELETIKLTVTGVSGDKININATPSSSHVLFVGGVENTPSSADGWDNFSDTIDEDGKRTYAVKFSDTGTYTIKVTVTSGPRAGDYDTVDITVLEKTVIFDVSCTVVIGESFTIKGTANTGNRVDIAVEDYVYPQLNDLVLDENREFSEDIDTSTGEILPFTDPGPVSLTAYIERTAGVGRIGAAETDDGSVKLFMLNNTGGGIDISASESNIGKNETIILTIGAMPGHNVSVTTADAAHTVFEYNRYDFTGTSNNIINIAPADTISIPSDIGDCDSHADAMNIHGVWKTMDGDGIRKFEVHFTDVGTYKITATDYGTAYPTATRLDEEDIEIFISEKNVTFDIPSIVAIGEILTIKGTSNTGDWVQIAVDDIICTELKKVVIDENGEFEKEIDTATACGNAFSVPDYVRLKAFIDTSYASWQDVSAYTDDGSTKVFMVRPWLTASPSTDSVDLGDEFTISGIAKGSKSVDILIISPKGAGGTKIDGTARGMYMVSTSVSMVDGTFSKKINVGPNVDTGSYLVAVLSPGADGKYGKVGWINLAEALSQYTLTARTQDEILEILDDIITLSDDLMWVDYIKVGEIETLTLNPIADVVVGNPLEVTGETSRKDGSIIWITVKKPYYEIVPQAAIVKDNMFKASFDTTGAQPGTYTVKAIDGYGYTAVASVNIIAETQAPTSFDTGEGDYPSIMGTHNGTITIQRMYTYPCTGTGGHSEYAAFYDQNETKIGEGHWKGYQSGDYHYITFDPPFTMVLGERYNYTIKTGSYPQIIHNQTHTTENGTITCTEFIDANGKEYNNWIPAIRLE